MLDSRTVILLYVFSVATITLCTWRIAKKKGRDPVPAAILAGVCALPGIVAGLVVLIVHAILPPKHYYCPKCGERNIFYLTSCRRCSSPLRK